MSELHEERQPAVTQLSDLTFCLTNPQLVVCFDQSRIAKPTLFISANNICTSKQSGNHLGKVWFVAKLMFQGNI